MPEEPTPEPVQYAVVDDETGEVLNLVLWDGETPWSPQEGQTAIRDEQQQARIGGSWVNAGFRDPPEPEA